MDKWIGKTAIVTGASAGIGAEIVRDFANAGINVIAMARRLERLDDLKNELKNAKGKVTAIKCDVSDKASIDAAFDEIEKKFGSIQILVNNAGIAIQAGVLNNDDSIDEKISNTIHTNFTGLVRVTRRAYQLMEKASDYGIIINNGSIDGHNLPFHNFHMNVYSATKFAVRGLTESLRQEIINKGNLKVRICVSSK
jgi:NADP+-dependent farnesol dehydrogenase